MCAGQGLGFCTEMGGGWSGGLIAHESMLTPAPGVPPERAVLAEPASVALHAALRWDRRGESGGDRVVVIGPGTIGLLVTAVLRRLHPDLDITVVCAGAFGAERAIAAGASRTVQQPAANVLAEVAAADLGEAPRIRPSSQVALSFWERISFEKSWPIGSLTSWQSGHSAGSVA